MRAIVDTSEPSHRPSFYGPTPPPAQTATCGHPEGMGVRGSGHCGQAGCPNLAPLATWEQELRAQPPQPTI